METSLFLQRHIYLHKNMSIQLSGYMITYVYELTQGRSAGDYQAACLHIVSQVPPNKQVFYVRIAQETVAHLHDPGLHETRNKTLRPR